MKTSILTLMILLVLTLCSKVNGQTPNQSKPGQKEITTKNGEISFGSQANTNKPLHKSPKKGVYGNKAAKADPKRAKYLAHVKQNNKKKTNK